MSDKNELPRKTRYRWLRRLGRVFAVFLLLFIVLVLFIRSPWGQDIIVSKAVNFVSDKTNTKVAIERIFITFLGNIQLEGLYLEDKQKDTLVYSRKLEVNLPFRSLIFGNEISVNSVEWDGLVANVKRNENSEQFNFDFLLEAFESTDTTTTTSTTAPLKIAVGSLKFSDFKINYLDNNTGIESNLKLGKLILEADRIDLEAMRFELDAFELYDTKVTYKQSKAFSVSENTTETRLPYVVVENFILKNVSAKYNSIPDKIAANIDLGNFLLELQKADLSKNDFEIGTVALSDSKFSVEVENDSSTIASPQEGEKFEWPNYILKVDKIALEKNLIHFKSKLKNQKINEITDLNVSDFRFQAEDLNYGDKKANVAVTDFSFREKSGFHLKTLNFNAQLNHTKATLSKFNISTENSFVFGDLVLDYPSVNVLLEKPEDVRVQFEIPSLNISLNDFFPFLPKLEKNEYLQQVSKKDFAGHMNASGTLKELKLEAMEINWGENTLLSAAGNFRNLTAADALYFNLKEIKAQSNKKDIVQFVSESDLGIALPNTVVFKGNAEGTFDNLRTNISLIIPEGEVQLSGEYVNSDVLSFEGNLKVDSLQLGTILANPQLGQISFVAEAEVSGNSLNTLNTQIKTDFTQLRYNDYNFSNLKLAAAIVNGAGDVTINFKDYNLDVVAQAKVNLDTINSNIDFKGQLKGADLYALGVTKNPIKTAFVFDAVFKGNATDFTFTGLVSDGLAVSNKEQFRMDDVALSAAIGEKSTNVKVNSKFLNLNLFSNAAPNRITEALQGQFKNYFRDTITSTDTIADPVTLKMNLSFNATPILTEVFLEGVEQLETISATVNFDETTSEIYAQLELPTVTYQGTRIDSVKVQIDGTQNEMNFDLGIASIASGAVKVQATRLTGNLSNKLLAVDFSALDEAEQLMHVGSEITLKRDTIIAAISPVNLILNKQKWTIPSDNEIQIAARLLNFKNFTLSNQGQELSFSNTIATQKNEHVGVVFKDFRLQSFTSLLNSDEKLVTGAVNGDLVFEFPFDEAGLLADFKIENLNIRDNPMGNLTLKAYSKAANQYNFNFMVKDGGLDMDLVGDYIPKVDGANLNLDLNLNKLQLSFIEGVTKDVIKDSKGYLSGKFKVTGTPSKPQYEGILIFKEANFNVVALNSKFKISEEAIKVNTSGIYLDKFVISDIKANRFSIDGDILTETLSNPAFDLQLAAQKFQVLNSEKGDNELFYGKGEVDASITIKGDLESPKVKGKLSVGEGTDFTYVVPESQLDLEERDGTVIFVNRQNPDAILTRNDAEDPQSIFKGFNLSTSLEIKEGATFTVIIDEQTGDNLKVTGNGDLNLNITPNGAINLAGQYELNSGHYETNLYNLVKRKFEINPGSTITWNGDPKDATLDVKAIYELETSASPLMASVTSGGDAAVSGKYRQSLPFLVYLNVNGKLLTPILSFGLDMPKQEQGALGGAVFDRVQLLNTQEAELNKQVFSLLALNRFFPDSGSDGSSGGANAIARNNVNKLLANEINAFADKVFGKAGVEVDFGLDSFTDYQGDSPTDRTQLNINASKKLFNDRVIITAGSSVDVEGSSEQGQTPVIGNLNIEYLLTEDGRYRLNGFQKTAYENAIDGQLTVTGVALILNWEFNKLSEVFSPFKNEEEEEKKNKNREIKKDNKATEKEKTKN